MFEMISAKEFFDHLEFFYGNVWPGIIIIHILAVACIILALKKTKYSDKIIAGVLCFLWLWDGIVHQLIFGTFKPIHKYSMLILWTVQAFLLFYFGIVKSRLEFKFTKTVNGIIGGVLIGFVLIIYPIIGFLLGHGYPRGPVLGIICPIDIFTIGFLFLTNKRMPKTVFIIPFIWSLFAPIGFLYWNVWEDVALLLAGLAGAVILFSRKKEPAELSTV